MTDGFKPRFTITNAIASGLTRIERARGFLEAAALSEEWVREMGRREIELLREYRERLIADVVTGKVDVREVAAQLPEEPPEEEAEWPGVEDVAETAYEEADEAGDSPNEEASDG